MPEWKLNILAPLTLKPSVAEPIIPMLLAKVVAPAVPAEKLEPTIQGFNKIT